MSHEPSALVGDPEHSVKLMGAHALLAGAEQVNREEPLVQRNMAIRENRSDRHGELLSARLALVDARARLGTRLRRQLVRLIGAAMRAHGSRRPTPGLKELAGRTRVREVRGGDRRVHEPSMRSNSGFVKCIITKIITLVQRSDTKPKKRNDRMYRWKRQFRTATGHPVLSVR